MSFTMRMPDLGTVDSSVKVVQWLAKVDQKVRRGEPLLEVETDKAISTVESFVSGTLQHHRRSGRCRGSRWPGHRDLRCRRTGPARRGAEIRLASGAGNRWRSRGFGR